MPTVKISILKHECEYDDYGNLFLMPIHQSDWIVVEEADVPKIRKGLELIGRRGEQYILFVKPIDELTIIQESLKLYEENLIQEEKDRKRREWEAMKKAGSDRIKKAISGLKRMIKQIEQGPTKDEALKASSISSLQAQINELQREKKDLK
jgi:ribosome-binding ATPase YchF (GTP1/OBG family)